MVIWVVSADFMPQKHLSLGDNCPYLDLGGGPTRFSTLYSYPGMVCPPPPSDWNSLHRNYFLESFPYNFYKFLKCLETITISKFIYSKFSKCYCNASRMINLISFRKGRDSLSYFCDLGGDW